MHVFSYLRKLHQKKALKSKSMLVLHGITKPFCWLHSRELGSAPHPHPPAGEPNNPTGRATAASPVPTLPGRPGKGPRGLSLLPWEAVATNSHQQP